MKTNLYLAALAAALTLPTVTAMAADKDTENKEPKQQPRPAQESRSGNATGKESTKPTADSSKPVDAEKPAPRSEAKETPKEDAKTQPRPAQESRSGATTGREATKSPETPNK